MVKDKVKKGEHLTVTKKANGQIALEWDWDALLKEVVVATATRSPIESKTTKRKTKK